MMWSVQLFNQINARKINDEMNVFYGIIHSHLFIYIWIAEAGLQVHGLLPRVSLHMGQLVGGQVHLSCQVPSGAPMLLHNRGEKTSRAEAVRCAQVIIMCVPQIGQFFKVRPQSWQEWLFALAVGMGSLLVAITTKLLSKCASLHDEHAADDP